VVSVLYVSAVKNAEEIQRRDTENAEFAQRSPDSLHNPADLQLASDCSLM